MLCATYSAVLQILAIRPLLCSRNVNENVYIAFSMALTGYFSLFLIKQTLPTTVTPSTPFTWLRANQFRGSIGAPEEYGVTEIHMDQVISVEHSTSGEAEDREKKSACHV